ncbi:2097_t:CDS:2 [Ambispora gerdemannii]|uniref:2097_t:CDS:1 n=1 Tax=Ambispora gerdemannii TaxID=144530 RepID=A0A9N9FBV2_9GLOM|nr:2097_t:CDS:2 [Ambispora gerdemannii]
MSKQLRSRREVILFFETIFFLEYIIFTSSAIVALFFKCQQIATTLEPIISNGVTNLFHEGYLETVKIIVIFAGFALNIAHLKTLPDANWWLEVHRINEEEFYNQLTYKKGRWYTIKALLKYNNAARLNKIFWKALQSPT